jgi:hypothetical protein
LYGSKMIIKPPSDVNSGVVDISAPDRFSTIAAK